MSPPIPAMMCSAFTGFAKRADAFATRAGKEVDVNGVLGESSKSGI